MPSGWQNLEKIVCELFQRSSGRREAHDNIQLNNRNIMVEFNCRLAGSAGGFLARGH